MALNHMEILDRTKPLAEDIRKLAGVERDGMGGIISMAMDSNTDRPDDDDYVWTKYPALNDETALAKIYDDHFELIMWLRLPNRLDQETIVASAREAIITLLEAGEEWANRHFFGG